MLKWLLYLIILANLGVLIWHLTRYQPPSEAMRQKQSLSVNADHIQVLKPRNPELSVPVEQSTTTLVPSQQHSFLQQQTNRPKLISATVLKSKQQPPDQPFKASYLSSPLKSESESSGENENSPSRETPSASLEPGQPIASVNQVDSDTLQACYSLNPLKEKQAKKFSQFLKKSAIKFKQQHTTKIRPAGYLAMVVPAKDYQVAKKILKQVKKEGLDAFLITKGQWQRGISLGVFSSRANAETIIEHARKKLPRINLKITDRVRQEIIYRVIFKFASSQDPQDLLRKSQITGSKGQFLAKVTKKSCKDIEF